MASLITPDLQHADQFSFEVPDSHLVTAGGHQALAALVKVHRSYGALLVAQRRPG